MKPKLFWAKYVTVALFLVILSSSAFGQFDDSHIEWKFTVAQEEVKPGSLVLLKGSAQIDMGWHLYSVLKQDAQRLEIEFIELDGLETASKLYSPKGERHVDTTFEEPYVTYDIYDKADIGIWLKVPENFTKSEATVKLKLSWQVCENLCIPGEETFELTVKIAENGQFIDKMTFPKNIAFAGDEYKPESDNKIQTNTDDKEDNIPVVPENIEKTKETENEDEKSNDEENVDSEDSQSLFWFLFSAAIAGLVSILTPCVFPMIPVTISYFLKTSEKKDTKPVLLSITYMLGIIFTLTFFGLVLALILGTEDIGNQIAGMPWINLIFAGILIVFTLSFFGLFELTLPSGIINALNKIGRNQQTGVVLSTFVLGVVFTLTSFACTGPIMGSIVLLAMKSGDYMRPFLGMLVYSVFFALPFLFLALSPGLLKKMPRSGIWMVKIKVYMGFIIFLFPWIFIVNVDSAWQWGIFTRPFVVAIWSATFLMMGLYALGKFRFKEEGASTETN
ncbi:MAG: hypothetical protein KAR20_22430, partial [Candidatus Heimdallarchaeota archaeon]|nr:hypothetical protein [Candidatus Heimdallarchaeota archaeon]